MRESEGDGSVSEEFYVGWQSKAPPEVGRLVKRTVFLLLVAVAGAGVLVSMSQRTIGISVFEWGKVKTFSGLLQLDPHPRLLMKRPGASSEYSSYLLVAPFKFGLKPGPIAPLAGKEVTLKGTLIYRDNQTMIEAEPASIKERDRSVESPLRTAPAPRSLGRQTLLGEIVDSKCYFGVMNPGRYIPHRACAIRCISGGIPPGLLVQPPDGPAQFYLLVSAQGKPVNQEILDKVAEPVRVTGEVVQKGDLLMLRADPAQIERVTTFP